MRIPTSLTTCALLGALSSSAFADDVPVPPPMATEPDPEPVAAVDEGDTSAGLIFNLNNFFTAGGWLGGWQGFGFGYTREMGAMDLRVGLTLGRATNPVNVVKTTQTNGTDVVTTYEVNAPGFTSLHNASAVVDMVKPLSDGKVAAYIGAGAAVSYSDMQLDYVDDVTVIDQRVEVDNVSRTLSIGGRGIFGVSYKVKPRWTLFAEYNLGVSVISWTSVHDATTTENSASGTPATMRVEQEYRETRWFNFGTGLGQGGALGLIAHF